MDLIKISRRLTIKEENMWRVIKIQKKTTAKELSISASQPSVNITQGIARSYLSFLKRAGYLKQRGLSYHLLPKQNTGKFAPLRMGKIGWFDRNNNIFGKFDDA